MQNRLKVWTPEEDQYLAAKVKQLGHKWTVIAAGLPGRPPLTCRNRWRKLARNICSDIGFSQENSPMPQSSTENSRTSPSSQNSEIFISSPDASSDPTTIDLLDAREASTALPSDSSLLDLTMNQLDWIDCLLSTPTNMFLSPQPSLQSHYQVPGITDPSFTPANDRSPDPQTVLGNTLDGDSTVIHQACGSAHQIHPPLTHSMPSSELEEASVQQAISSFIQDPTSEMHNPAAGSMQHQEHHHIHHVHIHHHHHYHHH